MQKINNLDPNQVVDQYVKNFRRRVEEFKKTDVYKIGERRICDLDWIKNTFQKELESLRKLKDSKVDLCVGCCREKECSWEK